MSNKIHEVFAYLCVKDACKASKFYQASFGAQETLRLEEPSGRIGHLELKLGPTTLMLSEEFPEIGVSSPDTQALNGAFCVHLHVDDCDALVAQARSNGAQVLMEPADQFYGERSARIQDPFGHIWLIGQNIEDVSAEEMQNRYTQLFS